MYFLPVFYHLLAEDDWTTVHKSCVLINKQELAKSMYRGEECCYFGKVGFLTHKFSFNFLACPNRPQSSKKGARRAEKEVWERRLGASQGFSFIMLRETKSRLDC